MGKKKQKAQAGDPVLDLATRALSYSEIVDQLLEPSQVREPGIAAFMDGMYRIDKARRNTILKERGTLRELVAEAEPRELPWRWTDYFFTAFPYESFSGHDELLRRLSEPSPLSPAVEEMLQKEGVSQRNLPLPNDRTLEAQAKRSVVIISELIKVKRFVSDSPEDWPEARFFGQETTYAKKVFSSRLFREQYHRLLDEYGECCENRLRACKPTPFLIDPVTVALIDAANALKDLSEERDFKFELVQLCRRFGLDGIQGDYPFVVAERFSIRSYGSGVTLRIPRYVTFDGKRSFPKDVVNALRKRDDMSCGLSLVEPVQKRAAVPDISPQAFTHRYYELIAESIKESRDLDMDNLHDQLAEELKISSSKDPTKAAARETRIRSARRFRAQIGLPAAGEDPLIRIMKNLQKNEAE